MKVKEFKFDYIRHQFLIELHEFSKSLKKHRLRKGMTLRQVEDQSGISNAYLSQLENGKIRQPSFETILILYRIYVLRQSNP